LLPDLTAVENVAMPLLINRWSQSKSIASARERLREVGIADRSDHPAGHLSGGEQQRAALARAMVAEPRVLLADEPTGNLDASNTLEIGAMLKNYSRTRQALVIVATHNEQLAAFCDRRYLLQQGSLLELAF
jgi:lipoprotein-releasing system ATP-binding protein